MTARSIRRAQERKARKLARKQANATISNPSSNPSLPVAETPKSVIADTSSYESHLQAYQQEFQPVGFLERELVESAANAHWRILRYQSIEMSFYARGRSEFAAKFEQEDPADRAALCDVETFVVYGKQIRHLELQENRLHRQREKDLAELRALQEARTEASDEAAVLSQPKIQADEDALLSEPKIQKAGFEFSNRVDAQSTPDSEPRVQRGVEPIAEDFGFVFSNHPDKESRAQRTIAA
jgi:hypothetical protein